MQGAVARLAGVVLGGAGLALLAACSSLGPTAPSQAPDSAVPAATYGSGPTKVALITLEGVHEIAGGAAASGFLAAQLDADLVGKAPITLMVWRYDGSKPSLDKIEDAILNAGVRLVIGPDDDTASQSLAGTVGRKGITVVSLGGVSSGVVNLFAFGLSGTVEASLTADEMRRRGYRSIALVSDPKGAAAVFASQLATAAVATGVQVTPVDGTDLSSATTRLAAMANAGQRPAAIVFVESTAAASALLRRLRGQSLFATIPAVGTSVWSFNPDAAAALGPGWYLAPDGNAIAGFTERFNKAFGQAPSPDGALTHDLVVLASALPQVFPGDAPYRPEVLTNSQGFVGVTGKFWFTPDGQVHRNLVPVELANR